MFILLFWETHLSCWLTAARFQVLALANAIWRSPFICFGFFITWHLENLSSTVPYKIYDAQKGDNSKLLFCSNRRIQWFISHVQACAFIFEFSFPFLCLLLFYLILCSPELNPISVLFKAAFHLSSRRLTCVLSWTNPRVLHGLFSWIFIFLEFVKPSGSGAFSLFFRRLLDTRLTAGDFEVIFLIICWILTD